jgi:hypothetical protein
MLIPSDHACTVPVNFTGIVPVCPGCGRPHEKCPECDRPYPHQWPQQHFTTFWTAPDVSYRCQVTC